MTDMVRMDDYKKDGSWDWAAYRKAQVANGEKCYRCGGYIMTLGLRGHRVLCYDCREMDSRKDDVRHENLIRCPKCRHQWPAVGDDDYENYSEGSHAVTCPECEYEFSIETNVSYSFTSPELIEEKESKEEEAENDEPAGEKDGAVDEVPPPGPEAPREGEGTQPGAGPGVA